MKGSWATGSVVSSPFYDCSIIWSAARIAALVFSFCLRSAGQKRKNQSGDSRRTPRLTLDRPLEDEHVVVRPAAGGGDFVPEGAIPELHLDPGRRAGKDRPTT